MKATMKLPINASLSNVSPAGWISIGVAVGTAFVSLLLLYAILWEHGNNIGGDSPRYLNVVISLARGEGHTVHTYTMQTDRILSGTIGHDPPLTTTLYSVLMNLGIPLIYTPIILGLLCWGFFLGGMGLLTYRLSHSLAAAAIAVVVAAVTQAYLAEVFTRSMSEMVFLPLLVWAMVPLVDLHQREAGSAGPLLVAALLLGLVGITRYSSVVIIGPVLLWWCWGRFAQRRLPWLRWELPLLGLALLPLVIWVLWGQLNPTDAFASSTHFQESTHTFLDGVWAVIIESSRLLLPAMHTFYDTGRLGIWGLSLEAGKALTVYSFFLLLIGSGLLLFVRTNQTASSAPLAPLQRLLVPPRSPIPLALAGYIGLYTIVQPLLLFWPIDGRDVTTALALAQPWLLSLVVRHFGQRGVLALSLYAGVNVALVLIPISLFAVPRVLSPTTLQTHPPTWEERQELVREGVPLWLLVRQPRTRMLERHHPDLATYLMQYDPLFSITNNKAFLFVADSGRYPTTIFSFETFDRWLEVGTCLPQSLSISVVLFEWDAFRLPFAEHRRQVAEKCPDLPYTRLEHSLVYRLDQTIPTYAEAIDHAARGEWASAIEIYDAALDANPDNVRASAERGQAHLAQGQWEQAVADFSQAIERMPGWPVPLIGRQTAYRELGQTEAARADEERLADLGVSAASEYVAQGRDLAAAGQPDAAIASFTRAIEIDPTQHMAYYHRAFVYRDLDEPAAALADFDRTIEINPNFAHASFSRGRVHLQMGNLDQALQDFDRSIALRPEYVHAYHSRGVVLMRQAQFEPAVAAFSAALDRDPTLVYSSYQRGLAHEELGDTAAAQADFEQVLAQEPNATLRQQTEERLQALLDAQQP